MIPKSTEYFHKHRDNPAFMAERARLRKKHQERCKTDPRLKLLVLLSSMKSRCYNPNQKAYHYYGGRGIRICAEWLEDKESYVNWALSNGWTAALEIDRIDVNGDYSPSNCRFVAKKQNCRNRRSTQINQDIADEMRALFAFGASGPDLAKAYGVTRDVVYHVKYGRCWN